MERVRPHKPSVAPPHRPIYAQVCAASQARVRVLRGTSASQQPSPTAVRTCSGLASSGYPTFGDVGAFMTYSDLQNLPPVLPSARTGLTNRAWGTQFSSR